MRSKRPSRRGLAAFLGALGLHALGAWFALTRTSPPPPERPIPIELRVVEREPAPKPPPPAPPPKIAKRPKNKPVPTPEPVKPATPVPESEIAHAPEAAPESPVAQAPGGGHASGETSAIPGTSGPAPAVDPGKVRLFDAGALSKSIHFEGPEDTFDDTPGAAPMGEESAEAEHARVAARVDRDVNGEIARGRVQGGLADPYFTRLAEGTKGAWKLAPSVLGLNDATDAKSQWQNFDTSYDAVRKAWARTGSPFEEEGFADPYGHARPVENGDSRSGGNLTPQTDLCIAWNNGDLEFVKATVTLQLVQEPDGKPVSTKVLDAQATARFIAGAREAIIAAARERLAPEHGFGLGGRRIKSVWKLSAKVYATNPQCAEFDEVLGIAPHPTLLPETRVKLTVELVALYDGETGPVPNPQ